jgi:hypothetical protein
MTMRRTIVFRFIAGTCIVAPAFAQTPYDGLWNATILTVSEVASRPFGIRSQLLTERFRVRRMFQAASDVKVL